MSSEEEIPTPPVSTTKLYSKEELKAQAELYLQVNAKGTKLWTRMNDSSKSRKFRAEWIAEHGGEFKPEGKFWRWIEPATLANGYYFVHAASGQRVLITNAEDFARAQGPPWTRAKVCDVYAGRRPTYMGWKAETVRPVLEKYSDRRPVNHTKVTRRVLKKEKDVKAREYNKANTKPPLYIKNRVTGEKAVILFGGIKPWCEARGIDPDNMRTLQKGKRPSVSDWVLDNPFEGSKDITT